MASRGITTKLFIGNLPDLCRKEQLEEKFKKYGNVVEFDIVSNFGFAHYENADEAKAAADALNGTDYNGNNLRVEVSHSRVRQKPGMGEKEGCFRCGQEGHWSKDCPRGPRRPRMPPGPGGFRDEPYREDPYMRGDPYADSYYRSAARFMPPPRYDPYYDPYDRRPLPLPPRDPYMRERMSDPYARQADYYGRRTPPMPSPGAGAGASRDPYAKEGYAARASADPYLQRAPDPYAARSADPYSPRSGDPYAHRSAAADPYAQRSSAAADPYAQRSSAADPYAQRSSAADPYAQRSADPYAQRAAGGDPYAKDPYAAASRDPYAASRARDPYEDYYEKRRQHAASVRAAPYPKPAASQASGQQSSYSSQGNMASSRVPGPY